MPDRFQVSSATPAHPTDELLIAYLTHTLDKSERANLENHLRSCDDCIQSLPEMRHQLSMIDEMPAQIPESVRRRAAEVAQQVPGTAEATIAHPATRSRGAREAWVFDWLASMLRLPVLVPVGVAALALLVIANRHAWFNPAPESELSRSLELRETLHVTSSETAVWLRPGGKASGPNEVIATLRRDQAIDVIGRQDDWYRVILPDRQQGWVERRAFE